ncbi:hypothetical protein N657DRAFT_651549 [Parathielavia appendiculata]|uniref:Uncharacterized protein n=1 Tax=Parathielavia appendiculata TaxID=2587402 RepID=A0AAN6TPF1_9PEZI|nr:hypothetical protein N657DRAFT_651549 [Parathielavia appendiculata]
MPHKPLRQLAAEKAQGTGANPSQLGDPSDLKAETSNGPDPVENPHGHTPSLSSSYSWASKGDNIGIKLKVPRSALEGDPDQKGEEEGTVVGIGDGAGPVGGVWKKGSKL